MRQLSLRTRIIGESQPTFIIAEAGVNHNGDINLAHRLIDSAANAGADAVKFQTFITEEVVSPYAPLAGHHITNVKDKISHFDLITKLELPLEAFRGLKHHCKKKNVIFISTPYDIPSAEFLINIGAEVIKVASSEMSNFPLLDVIRQSKIPVILSTGMSSWDEIVESVNFIKEYHDNICILKCTSNYPASPESINLRGITKLKESFPDCLVGFSDHSEGIEISLSALGFGVCIVEKHFTLDKNAWGPDHKASMKPEEFRQFVQAVRKSEKALGIQDWDIQDEELSQRRTMQKGVYTRRNIQKGEKVTLKDVKFLRPLGRMTPKIFYLKFIDVETLMDIPKNTALSQEMFE